MFRFDYYCNKWHSCDNIFSVYSWVQKISLEICDLFCSQDNTDGLNVLNFFPCQLSSTEKVKQYNYLSLFS